METLLARCVTLPYRAISHFGKATFNVVSRCAERLVMPDIPRTEVGGQVRHDTDQTSDPFVRGDVFVAPRGWHESSLCLHSLPTQQSEGKNTSSKLYSEPPRAVRNRVPL